MGGSKQIIYVTKERKENICVSKHKQMPINIDYGLAEFVDKHEKYLMSSINNYVIPLKWYEQYYINTNNMIYAWFDGLFHNFVSMIMIEFFSISGNLNIWANKVGCGMCIT